MWENAESVRHQLAEIIDHESNGLWIEMEKLEGKAPPGKTDELLGELKTAGWSCPDLNRESTGFNSTEELKIYDYDDCRFQD